MERKVKTVAVILALDKNQDDEMVYRYIIPTNPEGQNFLPGGILTKDVGASECVIGYVKDQLGLDIMEAGENQAILSYSSDLTTDPSINEEQDVVIIFSVGIQLQYLKRLMKDGKLNKRVDKDGDEEWAFEFLDPETDILPSSFVEEWEKGILIDNVKSRFGEDYFDELSENGWDDDEDEIDEDDVEVEEDSDDDE